MVSCIARSSLKHLLDNLLLLQTTMLASNADTKSILRADNSTSDTQSVPVWRLWCSLVLCLGLVFLCVSVGIFSQLFWVWLCSHLSTETRLLSSLLSSGMFNSLHWYTAQYHYITTPTATTTHFYKVQSVVWDTGQSAAMVPNCPEWHKLTQRVQIWVQNSQSRLLHCKDKDSCILTISCELGCRYMYFPWGLR